MGTQVVTLQQLWGGHVNDARHVFSSLIKKGRLSDHKQALTQYRNVQPINISMK